MEEFPKNQESEVGENTGAEALAEMPAFEEHMKNAEKEAPIGERYYEQARVERGRWVEASREKLKKAQGLKPEDLKICGNLDELRKDKTGRVRPEWRPIDVNNENDMAKFDKYKQREIEEAKEQIEEDENTDLDELARCCRNQEIIDQIATKLNDDEDFTQEELDFLGDAPKSFDRHFNFDGRFDIPALCKDIQHGGLIAGYSYREILKEPDIVYPGWFTIVKAQMREMVKQDQALLASNEEIQKSLEDMEERRNSNPFAGETNINSETGEARTFSLEDNYPRLENESEEDYANRLKRISLKTRLFEKRR
ncbi:hypothetical protein IJI18_00365 [Candidatus Saccharibacteria bacterium]|nr:hypothetical protein [Candidatus Saccharibacteria bacterium]